MSLLTSPRGSLSGYLKTEGKLLHGMSFVATEGDGSLGIYFGDANDKAVKIGATNAACYKGSITAAPAVWIHGGIYIYGGTTNGAILGTTFAPGDTFLAITSDGLNSDMSADTAPTLIPLGKGIISASNVTVDNSVHTRLGDNAQTSFENLDYAKFEYGGTVAELAASGMTTANIGQFFIQTSAADVTFDSKTIKHGSIVFITKGAKEEAVANVYTGPDQAVDIDFAFTSKRQATSTELGYTDTASTNVEEALNLLINTKADLDKDGKVPISQLPATVLGSLQYKGVLTATGAMTTVAALIATKADYTPDTGDYWIVALDVTVTNGDTNNKPFVELDGTKYNAGDWLVYDGAAWSKVDHDDNFNGILVAGDLADGTVEMQGSTRTDSSATDATAIPEVVLSLIGQVLKFSNPNAALFSDKDTVVAGNLYQPDANKVLRNSGMGFSLTDANNVKVTTASDTKILLSFTTGKTNYIPVFGEENLEASLLSVVALPAQTTSAQETAVGVVAHGDTDVTLNASTATGTILTNKSVLDCGLYAADGSVTYPNETASLKKTTAALTVQG